MPTYDYKCKKCEHVFEDFLPMSKCDEPLGKPCPECKGKKCIIKLLSTGAGIQFDVEGKKVSGLEGTAKGGIRDVFHRISESPGVKNTKHAQKFKDKL